MDPSERTAEAANPGIRCTHVKGFTRRSRQEIFA